MEGPAWLTSAARPPAHARVLVETRELRGVALAEKTTAQPYSFCLPAGLPFPVLRVRPLLLPFPSPRPLFDSHAVPRCPVFPKQPSLKLSRAGPGRAGIPREAPRSKGHRL